MLAQRRYEDVRTTTSRPRRRRKATPLQAVLRNDNFRVIAVATIVTVLLCTYIGAYASFTQKGYHRAQLLSSLAKVKKENQELRMTLERLRQPDKIETYARAAGMTQSEDTAYLGTAEPQSVAMNTER